MTEQVMPKFAQARPFANPERAVRELVEIAAGIDPSMTAVSTSKRSFLYGFNGLPAESDLEPGISTLIARLFAFNRGRDRRGAAHTAS